MAWTILHPNCFMECAGNNLRGGQWSFYYGDAGVGWIAVKDIATVAAVALREGPKKHHGKSYWLSTEVLNGPQIGALLTEQLGTPIMVDVKTDEDFLKDLHAHKFKQVMDDYYGKCFSVFLREVRTAGNYRDCKRRCAVRYRKTLHDIPAVDQGEQRELPVNHEMIEFHLANNLEIPHIHIILKDSLIILSREEIRNRSQQTKL